MPLHGVGTVYWIILEGSPTLLATTAGTSTSLTSLSLSYQFATDIACDCIQRKTWCMGPYEGADYNSYYLIVNFVVSYQPPLQRERGGVGGRSSPLVEHIWICLLISKITKRNRESTKKRGGRGSELSLCLQIDILWTIGNPMAELTLTPCCSWL